MSAIKRESTPKGTSSFPLSPPEADPDRFAAFDLLCGKPLNIRPKN
jgi:hypothetical protein